MANAPAPQPRQNELFDIDLSSLISMLFFSSIISLVLMIFSVTFGVIVLAGSAFFIVSFAIFGGFNRSLTAKEYRIKLWNSICLVFLFMLTRFIVGILLQIPPEVTWFYLWITIQHEVPVAGILVSKIVTLFNWSLPDVLPVSQVRIALLLDVALLGFGLMIAVGWEKGDWGKKLTKWLYIGMFAFALLAAIINIISPIALQKILGWGPQFNELIGNPLPEKLTGWGLLVLAAAIAVFAYCWKTKKWNAIFGVLLLVAIATGTILAVQAVTGHFRTGKWPWENKSFSVPTTHSEELGSTTTLFAHCILDSGIGADSPETTIIISGEIQTKNGTVLDANGWPETKNHPGAICREANLYQVIATLDPETKGGWFPVGKQFMGEISPLFTEIHFMVNAKPELLSRFDRDRDQSFSVSIK